MSALLGRKFLFAVGALGSLTAIAVYAIHAHDTGTASAAVAALGVIGPTFIHSQRKADEHEALAEVAKAQP